MYYFIDVDSGVFILMQCERVRPLFYGRGKRDVIQYLWGLSQHRSVKTNFGQMKENCKT